MKGDYWGLNPADNEALHSCSITPEGENTTKGLRVKKRDREGHWTVIVMGEETDLTWVNDLI